ncbi:MAG TPA: beta-1,6-N-acetylglucosaminyltransferase, partial [Paenirhodobacter sp.]
MSVGVVMICHTALDRAAKVARFWAEGGGASVAIHVDAAVPTAAYEAMSHALADLGGVSFTPRYRCAWGTWSLVAAAQAGAEAILARDPDAGHVLLTSGACLPLRPVADLSDYLAAHPGTDFIESVTTADVEWTVGGLDAERFTLHFPFSWKSQRGLFDRYVDLQRRIGFQRRIPDGLTPHLGSQWWCLSRATLHAILTDPQRPRYDRYFRHVWIPDESYFQTMARRHSERIESRSLTLSRFDNLGKPYVFYDDHQKILHRSGCFVARKIWPRADLLYRSFLTADQVRSRAEPDPMPLERLFTAATERRRRGRPGLYMQSRFPKQDQENGKTFAPYSVFQGFAEVFEDFGGWLGRQISA